MIEHAQKLKAGDACKIPIGQVSRKLYYYTSDEICIHQSIHSDCIFLLALNYERHSGIIIFPIIPEDLEVNIFSPEDFALLCENTFDYTHPLMMPWDN